LRELLNFRFGALLAMPLVPDDSAARGEKQDQAGDQIASVLPEEVAKLVAAEILVDLLDERVCNVRGLR